MLILGIDPGLRGALALFDGSDFLFVQDMPILALERSGRLRREVDIHGLFRIIDGWKIKHAWVEQVHSMPHEGVSSAFAFGKGCGIIECALVARLIPYTFVTPQTWKKKFNVPKAKDGARARASQLLPAHSENWQRVKDDGRAEASLIALYGFAQRPVPIRREGVYIERRQRIRL